MDVPYKLYKGDCLEIMPTLEAGSVDAIITDLPYGTTACAWDEIIPYVWRAAARESKSHNRHTQVTQTVGQHLAYNRKETKWITVKNG